MQAIVKNFQPHRKKLILLPSIVKTHDTFGHTNGSRGKDKSRAPPSPLSPSQRLLIIVISFALTIPDVGAILPVRLANSPVIESLLSCSSSASIVTPFAILVHCLLHCTLIVVASNWHVFDLELSMSTTNAPCFENMFAICGAAETLLVRAIAKLDRSNLVIHVQALQYCICSTT